MRVWKTLPVAVLVEHLVDTVLDLVSTLAQSQVHVSDRLVLLDRFL